MTGSHPGAEVYAEHNAGVRPADREARLERVESEQRVSGRPATLRELRGMLGVTVEQMAAELGITRPQVTDLEDAGPGDGRAAAHLGVLGAELLSIGVVPAARFTAYGGALIRLG